MKKKVVYLVSLILVTLFLVGFIIQQQGKKFFGKPKPSSPSLETEWRTYENKDKKFSFKYPSDWLFSIIFDNPQMFGIELRKEDGSQEKVAELDNMTALYQISLVINDNPDNLSAKDYRLKQLSEGSFTEEQKKFEEVHQGGADGVRFLEGAAPSSGPAAMIIFAHDKKLYKFSYSAIAHPDTHEKFLEVFNQLIASLSFK